jgi:hypothetical protein
MFLGWTDDRQLGESAEIRRIEGIDAVDVIGLHRSDAQRLASAWAGNASRASLAAS